jgi:LysR family nitrogen assimilation transcriptional regulator
MVYLQESSGTALNDKLLAGQLDMAVLYERSPPGARPIETWPRSV